VEHLFGKNTRCFEWGETLSFYLDGMTSQGVHILMGEYAYDGTPSRPVDSSKLRE
jgi:hypothetical protein